MTNQMRTSQSGIIPGRQWELRIGASGTMGWISALFFVRRPGTLHENWILKKKRGLSNIMFIIVFIITIIIVIIMIIVYPLNQRWWDMCETFDPRPEIALLHTVVYVRMYVLCVCLRPFLPVSLSLRATAWLHVMSACLYAFIVCPAYPCSHEQTT